MLFGVFVVAEYEYFIRTDLRSTWYPGLLLRTSFSVISMVFDNKLMRIDYLGVADHKYDVGEGI